jgi:hypothetical protein
MSKRFTILVTGAVVAALVAMPVGEAVAKKKKPKPKPPVACAAFAPGDYGKDKPTAVITDAATEAAPVEQTISLDMSAGDADLVGVGQPPPTFDQFNIQVDTATPDTGLYVLFEFPERRDYDIDLLHTDGSYAARSHDFNLVLGAPNGIGENGGHGGEATTASEKLVGIRTADCGGWTLEATNWLGEGGDMKVKVWLGPVVNDPLAPGEEPHA